MAKFLPFVVEKSTPIHIFQTLVSRSKGMNNLTVISILKLVLDIGIRKVRNTASALPEMDLGNLYEEILNAHPTSRISTEEYSKIILLAHDIKNYVMHEIADELQEYEVKDILGFLLVMHYKKRLKDYTSLTLGNLFNGKAEKAEVNLIDSDLFADDGSPYYFNSKEDLIAYVWLRTVIATRDTKFEPVKAVYTPGGKTTGSTSFGNAPSDKDNYNKYGKEGSYKEEPRTHFDFDYDDTTATDKKGKNEDKDET